MIELAHIGRSPEHEAFLASRSLQRIAYDDPSALPYAPAKLSWMFPGEHCTECAAPDCHATCDAFERSPVGRCRRFVGGLAAVPTGRKDAFRYGLETVFKPWARLLVVGNTCLMPPEMYRRCIRPVLLLSRLSYGLQAGLRLLPPRVQWRLTDKMLALGNRVPRTLNQWAARRGGSPPDALLVVVGNPQRHDVPLEIGLSGFGQSQHGRHVQRVVSVQPGWNFLVVPRQEVAPPIDLHRLFRVTLVPLVQDPVFLQFLYLGWVRWDTKPDTRPAPVSAVPATSSPPPSGPVSLPKIKVVVVDLDHTLWDGILIEDPDRNYPLRPGVREALEELDRRGILLSIASKNNEDDARRALQRLGLWELFLYPQIHWEPKSIGVKAIARHLNVGLNTVAFVDDAAFEREEVRSALPDVRTYDGAQLPVLPSLSEFDVPVTEESRRRRRFYQDEIRRQEDQVRSRLDYDAFLQTCDIRLKLERLAPGNFDRVHELTQRTNQLNFSGNRYTRESLQRLADSPDVWPAVLRCEDRYGDYGIVGFSVLRVASGRLEMADLMFSCRIQGKKVEHAWLAYLLQWARDHGLSEVVGFYRRTPRNTPAGRVLDELSFSTEPSPDDPGVERRRRATDTLPGPFPVRVEGTLGLAPPP